MAKPSTSQRPIPQPASRLPYGGPGAAGLGKGLGKGKAFKRHRSANKPHSSLAPIQSLQTLRCCISDTSNRKVLRDNIQAVTKGDIKYVIFNLAINQIQTRGCTAATHLASGLVSLP